MAALDFPNSPTLNQQYTHPTTGIIWVWDGAKWVSGTGATAYAPIASPVFTGNPQAPNPPAGDADTSVATTSFVAAAVAGTQGNVGRNLIHNSMFNVAQRGAGPFGTLTAYTLDRWLMGGSGDTFSVAQIAASDAIRAAIGDEAVTNVWTNNWTGTAGAGSYLTLSQPIEGIHRLAGKTVTLSFWAACGAGSVKIGINYLRSYGIGGSPSAMEWNATTGQSVTVSGWARYSITTVIASATGKTLGTSGNYIAPTLVFSSGATNNVLFGSIGVQSSSLYLWGVQLEIGSVATPLEKPDPQVDLANCQRFYTTFAVITLCPVVTSINGHAAYVAHPVTMHHTPTYVSQHVAGNVSLGITYNYQSAVGVWTSMAGTPVAGNYEVLSVTASADL